MEMEMNRLMRWLFALALVLSATSFPIEDDELEVEDNTIDPEEDPLEEAVADLQEGRYEEASKIETLLVSLKKKISSEIVRQKERGLEAEKLIMQSKQELERLHPELTMIEKLLSMVKHLNGKQLGSAANPAASCKELNKDGDFFVRFGDKNIKVRCSGKWTMVANLFDTNADDFPNDPKMVETGWTQTGNGRWSKYVSSVLRSTTQSSALGAADVLSLTRKGYRHLLFCYTKDTADVTCRDSLSGSLTLVSYDTGNPRLAKYRNNKLVYTYFRLTGMKGSADDYNNKNIAYNKFCVPVKGGSRGDFGTDGRLCEHTAGCWEGVFHGWGYGMSLRPWHTGGDEIGACNSYNQYNGIHVYMQ